MRLAVILKYYTGLTERQIADTLKCPVGTVKSRLHAARAKLARALSEYEINDKEVKKRMIDDKIAEALEAEVKESALPGGDIWQGVAKKNCTP